jgi:hypothetical protein
MVTEVSREIGLTGPHPGAEICRGSRAETHSRRVALISNSIVPTDLRKEEVPWPIGPGKASGTVLLVTVSTAGFMKGPQNPTRHRAP